MEAVYEKYFRDNIPHIWCAGCGNGIVMGAFARAMEKLGWDQDDTVVLSGIGCSSRITGYLDFSTMHTAHGRALAVATGVKMAEPRLKVVVFMGDGDAAAIGGNHFIHACRRNLDITAVVINNYIYGMTGGQFSPLTPFGKKATTAPYGSIDRSFDMVELAKGAGASYVARGDVFHVKQLVDLLAEAGEHKGFSLVEVISACPVSYGRNNKMAEPIDLLMQIKKDTVNIKAAQNMSEEDLAGKIVVGRHYQADLPEYSEVYADMVAGLQKGGEGR